MSIQWNSRWRAFEKGISTAVQIYKKRKKNQKKGKKKEKKWDSGTGTTLTGTCTTRAKRGNTQLVLVLHLLVPIPTGVHGQIRAFSALFFF